MSGPAGGVTGALWVALQAGFPNLLTVDVGGTSTDVALIMNGVPRLRRETTVGDVTVRASSVDIRSVGAGGGSIAHVPELTKALRVGPQSAGADPGPAAYGRGGVEPTVTDANVVLGYLPAMQRLGGDLELKRDLAAKAVGKVADALGKSVEDAAQGIYDIVNENMVGALRLVSVEQGHDPRDFALIAFGGAGPLHANALSRLLGSWPSIIPPGPGVLCALGDATTALRDESARTFIRKFSETTAAEIGKILDQLSATAAAALEREKVPAKEMKRSFQVDVRYHGQGLRLTVDVDPKDLKRRGLKAISEPFDAEHKRLFTFALPLEHEFVALRASVQGRGITVKRPAIARGDRNPKAAAIGKQGVYIDHVRMQATVYDRAKLRGRQPHQGPRDRDRNGLDHRGAAEAHGPGRQARQHPHLPGQAQGLALGACHAREDHPEEPQALPQGQGGQRHHRHHRERAPERALRNGRGAVPHRDVSGHPRAARRVPADREPRRQDGGRPVRLLHRRLHAGLRRHDRGRRRVPDQRSLFLQSAPSATSTTGWC